MRFPMIAVAATLFFLPATVLTFACEAQHSAQATSTELSAAEEKKPVKKKVAKVKKEKVEYMRAAPMK
jgi:hypothetical protein